MNDPSCFTNLHEYYTFIYAIGSLNGMGKPSKSMFLMIFYYIVVRMPLAYLLSYLGFGLNGIWVAVLISHVVASAAASISGTISFKKRPTAE